MERDVRRRLTLGFASNLINKLSTAFIQLVQVPVFLHYWTVALYGEWLILSSIPAYLSLSNIGFGSVAYNEMTMSIGAGDQDRALRVFQSCWWLIIALCSTAGITLGVALWVVPIADLLNFHQIGEDDTRWALIFLGSAVLLGQLETLLGSAYTCVGRYSYGSFLKSCISLFAFATTMVAVILHAGARDTAIAFAFANACGTLFLAISVRRDIPWISFGWKYAAWSEIKRLAGPAVAFMGLPIGNALNIQGSLLVVGYALGPLDVVVFGTARTVSRVALQFVTLINNTFWPELSGAYGAKNWPLIRTLHRRACQFALITATVTVSGMITVGPWFLNHWTDGHVSPNRPLLSILLMVVILNSLWSTSSTLVLAINMHKRLASYYVLGTGITLVATYYLARHFGLYGAAASLLISDFIMNLYVLPNSLQISQDTFKDFSRSLLEFPPSLQLKSLLMRVRQSRFFPQS
jgi:O-antigen/teichoic acid export membrane protein